MSSPQHIKKSRFTGENGQRRFYDSCKAIGREIYKSTKEQDIGHVDFLLDGETVDVKGLKDSHKRAQILIELKNVQGKHGWCSPKGPEWVAFDFGIFFINVKNSDLLKLVAKKCDLTDLVSKCPEALYKGYSRKDRGDLMTLVTLTDVVKHCKHDFIPYSEFHQEMDLL